MQDVGRLHSVVQDKDVPKVEEDLVHQAQEVTAMWMSKVSYELE